MFVKTSHATLELVTAIDSERGLKWAREERMPLLDQGAAALKAALSPWAREFIVAADPSKPRKSSTQERVQVDISAICKLEHQISSLSELNCRVMAAKKLLGG